MIILDTNVVSEVFRVIPHGAVQSWIDAQPFGSLYICAPVLAEIRFGISLLKLGQRRTGLQASADQMEYQRFEGRILPFDARAAAAYGDLAAARQRLGKPIGKIDGFIAAIALVNGADIATRDAYGFFGLGLKIFNPFESKS